MVWVCLCVRQGAGERKTAEEAVESKGLETWEWRVVKDLHNPGQVTYALSLTSESCRRGGSQGRLAMTAPVEAPFR